MYLNKIYLVSVKRNSTLALFSAILMKLGLFDMFLHERSSRKVNKDFNIIYLFSYSTREILCSRNNI